MKLKDWFEQWGLTKIKLSAGFFESEWQAQTADRDAAWELYVELLTRIVTQPLPDRDGDEQAALNSVHSLFGITREILRRQGRNCEQFSKVAIVVLNQVVRPFTAKWHKLALAGAFEQPQHCREFRDELKALQLDLLIYAKALAAIAQVEDLTAAAFDDPADR